MFSSDLFDPNRKKRKKKILFPTVENHQKIIKNEEITYAMVLNNENENEKMLFDQFERNEEEHDEDFEPEIKIRKVIRKEDKNFLTAKNPQIATFDLESYYNLRTTNENFYEIKTSIFSNQNEPLFKIADLNNFLQTKAYVVAPENKVETGFIKLQDKKIKIDIIKKNLVNNNVTVHSNLLAGTIIICVMILNIDN